MRGQWLGKISGEIEGTLRLELEERDGGFRGHAYIFYDPQQELPGFKYQINLPKDPPHIAEVGTIYLYPSGGEMTRDHRREAEQMLIERFGEATPVSLKVEFALNDRELKVTWTAPDGQIGSSLLTRSDINGDSLLVKKADLTTWDEFREWAVDQKPRRYIFRGQSDPNKLASSFYRTRRNDLAHWISQDVKILFGALIEQVSYPLVLGNLEHNAAIWSLLQHHGYPTPLLDWTFSPFVAAYFAFQNVENDQAADPRIFIFDQAAWNEKYGLFTIIADASRPQMIVLESLTVGNPRSGPQQSLSTVANVADIEAFVREREQEDGRTYLTACDLQASARPKIMRELELMGITYGSLFPGLDGICRDIRNRLFAEPS